jgi:hypothetical protein
MTIYDEWWAWVWTRGPGPSSASALLRWPQRKRVTAQAAISGIGPALDKTYPLSGSEIGFSQYVRSGKRHYVTAEAPDFAPVFFMDDINELEVTVSSWSGWITGGATVRLWD